MKRIRVCIYGGTDLQGTPTKFITELAYKLLTSIPAIIVTGGFLHSNEKPHAISTDNAALAGARKYADEMGVDLCECFEAWVPEPALDKRPDVNGAVRMTADEGITVRVLKDRTPLGRRLAMVADVDIVITISGKRHTEVVVEQALELGIPVFPIPNAGGDSEDLLVNHQGRMAMAFAPGALEQCLRTLTAKFAHNMTEAARAVVDLVKTARFGKCLVLLPYDDEHNKRYASVLEPEISKHMIPVRLDRIPSSAAIYTSFADAVRTSSAIIADITQLNENVMYEIGYIHGLGITPLIYTTEEQRLKDLPVYFRTLNVRYASPETPLDKLVNDYLLSSKIKSRFSGPK